MRGRPKMNKTYRQNIIRFSYMEDTIKNIVELVDKNEHDKIKVLLSDLVDREKQKVASKTS
ncbi:hypothetical protein PDK03_29450 [Bacillus cereus group sp. TH204-1LC]|uniref:hypothetical protein n=1 Tax=Bacillus cereus group TaxID=86661 RepID=UPI001E42D89D|nr:MULTISPECIES: hypothetical protein [Bacillus cereus group]MCC2392140.1 hypothetical protein [Bacillus pacificus]MCU5452329.1 hypothetical protein [Bacillus cereus]MDA1620627.1 hypothetical protein [Bacillus cereus group sp. TH204-1LC]